MYQITEDTIPEDIIDRYFPKELKLREKAIRKANEFYQWHPESYRDAQKGDYSFLKKVLEWHFFYNC